MDDPAGDRDEAEVFRSFFDSAVDMLCIAALDGFFRRVNPAWQRVLGWSSGELLARPCLDFVHPDDVAATREMEAALRRGETVLHFVNRYRTQAGDWRDLEWTSVVVTGEGLIHAVARDVTERQRRARHAREIEAESGVGSWEMDVGSCALYWSPQTFTIHDLPPGHPPPVAAALAFYPPEARALIEPALERLMQDGTPYDLVTPFVTATGRRRWVRGTAAAEWRGGAVVRVFGTFQDVTEQRQAERRLTDIIRGTNAGTWEWNVQTGETVFNERWAEIIGYSLAELGPTSIDLWMRFAHPDDLLESERRLRAHFAGETDSYGCEARMRHRDGHWVWVLDLGRVATWTPDGKPEWMSGTHIDISERKAQEAALEAARADAEAANAAKSRFLAVMSHEIRTPLNGVLGMADVLDGALADPAHKRMAGLIRESGALLLDIINDVLDLSKIEAGRIDLEVAPFLPSEIARRIEAVYALRAQAKGLSFSVMATRGDEVPRLGDAHRVTQLLHNLIGNAMKFTETGSVTVLLDSRPDRPLSIVVEDTGIGMTEDQVARMFEDFVQADSSTTRRFGGTGLGMAIVKRLVERMDGRIAVESTLGRGTRIALSLPLAPVEDVATVASVVSRAAPLPRLRLLAADDNEVNRVVLAAMLAQFGVEAEIVAGGADAVTASARGGFDAVLLDISMPDMDGVETLTRIRAVEAAAGRPPVPAVAVTANALAHQVACYRASGFCDHLAKPLTLATVDAALRALAAARPCEQVGT